MPKRSKAKGPFPTVAAVKRANRAWSKRSGRAYWFEPGAMRFFNTRLHGVVNGRYLITSNRPDDRFPYTFSVVKVMDDGRLQTTTHGKVGGVGGEYTTEADARAAAEKMPTANPGGKTTMAKRKATKRKATKRKATKRRATKRRATKRKAVKRKAVKRKAVKRKAVKRKAVKRKAVKRKAVKRAVVGKRVAMPKAQQEASIDAALRKAGA